MILITNNAHTHPPDRFAAKTAELITPLDDGMSAERRDLAYRFRDSLAAVLEPYYQQIDTLEWAACEADAKHLTTPIDGFKLAKQAFAKLLQRSKGTLWEGHWIDPTVQDQLFEQVNSHFLTAQSLMRGKYIAENPSNQG